MNKKLLLTSIVALGFVCPVTAFAYCDTCETVEMNDFPADGILKENKRYLGGAGTVFLTDLDWNKEKFYAIAEYEPVSGPTNYLKPGTYLDAAGNVTDCNVEGYYCPGGDVTTGTGSVQGLSLCPTGYNKSDSASRGKYQCYKTCTTEDAVSAKTLIGKNYYGNVNTCEPSECSLGWHIEGGPDDDIRLGDDLLDLIGNDNGISRGYVTGGHSFFECTGTSSNCVASNNASDYDLSVDEGYQWAVDYGAGYIIRGKAGGPDTTCNCQATGYIDGGGHYYDIMSPWVRIGTDITDADECVIACAEYMADATNYDFRSTLIKATVSDEHTSCVANTIEVIWRGTTKADIDANDAGTVTYGGDIRTPVKADESQIPAGYRFKGWKFSSTE